MIIKEHNWNKLVRATDIKEGSLPKASRSLFHSSTSVYGEVHLNMALVSFLFAFSLDTSMLPCYRVFRLEWHLGIFAHVESTIWLIVFAIWNYGWTCWWMEIWYVHCCVGSMRTDRILKLSCLFEVISRMHLNRIWWWEWWWSCRRRVLWG